MRHAESVDWPSLRTKSNDLDDDRAGEWAQRLASPRAFGRLTASEYNAFGINAGLT
jgi:hypothetical protein